MPLIAYILIAGLAAFSLGPVLAAVILRRQTSEWSPEHIAYILLRDIAKKEERSLASDRRPTGRQADRKWLLDTFAECMQAVKDPDKRLSQSKL